MRRALGSADAALADDSFIRSLYLTLQAWGIGARASEMLSEVDFAQVLRDKAAEIAHFEGMRIDDPTLNVSAVSDALWYTIKTLGIVANEANIVPGTKTLHHIHPELVVPVDRAYTQRFFDLHNPQFQYGQEKVFRRFFATFVAIARRTNPEQYVGEGWNSSRTKVIDNAMIGLLLHEAPARSIAKGTR